MHIAFIIVHLLISCALAGLILLQSSKGGLGSAFGNFEYYRTKRGAERIVFSGTIVLAVLFLITSITGFIIR